MNVISLKEFLNQRGIKVPEYKPEDFVMRRVATIGDLAVNADEHLVNITCDNETIMSIMRKDGGLQELAEALLSLAK